MTDRSDVCPAAVGIDDAQVALVTAAEAAAGVWK